MPTDYPQPDKKPSRLSEQMQIDLPSLVIQERALLTLTNGPFPERKNDFHDFSRVLDVACGAGSWVMEVARVNPHLEVVGIAAQNALVIHASERAEAAGLNTVRFLLVTGDERPQLPFPAETFDLVNTQYLHAWLYRDEWLDFVRDCWRVPRPGGYIRMTEPERGQSTSLAFERIIDLYLQALHKNGQRVSPDERHIGAANQLMYFCQQAGWTELTRHAYITDLNKDGALPAHYATQRLQLYARTFQPLILQTGLASAEELATLLQQASAEVERADFAANRFLITVCGRKPEAQNTTQDKRDSENLASEHP